MKIAICSDIHDNIWKLADALSGLHSADAILFLGDFCAPFTLKQLAEDFHGDVHVVFGNNDGDQRLLTTIAASLGNVTIHGEFAELTIDECRFALTHYPAIAAGLAASEAYDVVCYGHNHTLNQSEVGKTLLLNPGELMGRFGRSTYLSFETDDKSITVIDV